MGGRTCNQQHAHKVYQRGLHSASEYDKLAEEQQSSGPALPAVESDYTSSGVSFACKHMQPLVVDQRLRADRNEPAHTPA